MSYDVAVPLIALTIALTGVGIVHVASIRLDAKLEAREEERRRARDTPPRD